MRKIFCIHKLLIACLLMAGMANAVGAGMQSADLLTLETDTHHSSQMQHECCDDIDAQTNCADHCYGLFSHYLFAELISDLDFIPNQAIAWSLLPYQDTRPTPLFRPPIA